MVVAGQQKDGRRVLDRGLERYVALGNGGNRTDCGGICDIASGRHSRHAMAVSTTFDGSDAPMYGAVSKIDDLPVDRDTRADLPPFLE
ncbi:MAG: hypothetical protein R2855_12535 [Thermomicrobiales bacterium]